MIYRERCDGHTQALLYSHPYSHLHVPYSHLHGRTVVAPPSSFVKCSRRVFVWKFRVLFLSGCVCRGCCSLSVCVCVTCWSFHTSIVVALLLLAHRRRRLSTARRLGQPSCIHTRIHTPIFRINTSMSRIHTSISRIHTSVSVLTPPFSVLRPPFSVFTPPVPVFTPPLLG